ncbi:MAG: hypothetical protein C4329_00445 [Chitinophagaceae bacterium]
MKKIVLALVVVCLVSNAFAQEEKKGFQKEKVFVGGNLGLSFGDYTLINLSPQIGYRFNKFIGAGLGINGQYISLKERDYNGDPYRKVSQGVVGLNLFGRFYPIEHFMIQVQPEGNYIFGNQKFYATSYQSEAKYKLDAVIVPSILVGGGLVIPSGRGATIMSLMYDVLQQQHSPYGKQPIVNVGFNINL